MAELAAKAPAVSPILALLKAGGQAIDFKGLHQLRTEGRKALGSEGFDLPEMTGGAVGPVAGATALPVVQSLVKRMLLGAGIGGTVGGLSPTNGEGDYADEKAAQIGGGALVGGAVPAAGAVLAKAGKTIYHGLIEPWANPAAIKGRAYLEAAGDKVKEIIDLLAKNKQIVPGSAPNAGEAATPAGRAEFSALQESAKKAAPSSYVERNDAQNAARLAAIGEVAGDPSKRAAAVEARTAASAPHYAAGQKATTWELSGLKALNDRPSMAAVVKRAERLAEEKGDTFSLTKADGSMRPLEGKEAHFLKLAFDDLIMNHPKSSADTAELQALKETRKTFIDWMESKFPDLAAGRANYKEGSKPINQMDVGTTLREKLTPALRDDAKQRAGVFAESVRNAPATLKKATGEPRFSELEQILTARQLKTVDSVQNDLARGDRHMELARAGAGSANAIDLATQNMEREAGGKFPNMLHRGAMLANAIITRLEGKVNRKLATEMAVEMLHPPKVGEALGAAQARAERNKMIADAILKAQPALSAGAAAVVARNQGD